MRFDYSSEYGNDSGAAGLITGPGADATPFFAESRGEFYACRCPARDRAQEHCGVTRAYKTAEAWVCEVKKYANCDVANSGKRRHQEIADAGADSAGLYDPSRI